MKRYVLSAEGFEGLQMNYCGEQCCILADIKCYVRLWVS